MSFKLKDFREVMPKDMDVLITNEDSTTIYFDGEAIDIPNTYNDYTVVGTGFSVNFEMLIQLSKNELN